MPIKKSALVVIIVIVLVPAVILNTPIGYVPLIFLGLASLISVIYTLIIASTCKVAVKPGALKRYERESSVDYEVQVVNRSFLVLPHICVTLGAESTQGFPNVAAEYILMLGPREEKTLRLPLEFPHIGVYEVKISRLRFYGFLGVFSLAVKPRWKETVRVTPKHYDVPELNIYTSRPVFAVDFSSQGKIAGGEYSDVRQYVPGDPIKNIHWKLSAHTSDYVTRVLQTDAVSGVSIYMDMRVSQHTEAEEMAKINDCTAEGAYSAALHAFDRDYVVELIHAHGNSPTVICPKDLEMLHDTVCGLPPVSKSERFPMELLISEHSCRTDSLDNIVVLSSMVDERLIGALAACRQLGKYPVLCCIDTDKTVQSEQDELARRLAGKGIVFYRIDSAHTLSCLLGGERP